MNCGCLRCLAHHTRAEGHRSRNGPWTEVHTIWFIEKGSDYVAPCVWEVGRLPIVGTVWQGRGEGE